MRIKSVLTLFLFLIAISVIVSCQKMSDDFVFNNWQNCTEIENNRYNRYIPFEFICADVSKNTLNYAIASGLYTNNTDSFLCFVLIDRVYTCFDSKLALHPLQPYIKSATVHIDFYDSNGNVVNQDDYEDYEKNQDDYFCLDLGQAFYNKITNCNYAYFTIKNIDYDDFIDPYVGSQIEYPKSIFFYVRGLSN